MARERAKKVLFVTFSLSGGGAEKTLQLLLRHLDRTLYQSMLVALDTVDGYELAADVPPWCLHKAGRLDFFRLIYRLARILKQEKPDVAVGFLTYPNIVLVLAKLLAGYKGRIILSEHNNPQAKIGNKRNRYLRRLLIRKLYPLSDYIVCVSNGVAKALSDGFSIAGEKIQIIHNSVDIGEIAQEMSQTLPLHWYLNQNIPVILMVGRLDKQKGYGDLLNAFAIVRQKRPCRLVILGDGQDKQKLVKHAADLGIASNVAFLGFQKNPYSFMAHSTVFVLSSHWEGFGNVIIEAMACGVPVISTNCPCGPGEIITDVVNGLLIPVGDIDTMAKAILKLLEDEAFRKRLVQAGRRRAEDFRVEQMIAEYEKVFEQYAGWPASKTSPII